MLNKYPFDIVIYNKICNSVQWHKFIEMVILILKHLIKYWRIFAE